MSSSATTPRKALSRQLRATLAPRFIALGFRYSTLSRAYLRVRPGFTDRLSVYRDKYGRPRFVIDYQMYPRDCPLQPGQPWPADLSALGCVRIFGFRIKPRLGIGTRSWYCLDRPLLLRWLSGRYCPPETLVAKALAHFGELERWWATGEVGPHMGRNDAVLHFKKRPPAAPDARTCGVADPRPR